VSKDLQFRDYELQHICFAKSFCGISSVWVVHRACVNRAIGCDINCRTAGSLGLEHKCYPRQQRGCAHSGNLIAVPYAARLIRAGRASGFLRWEKHLLATVYLMPLFAFQAGLASHLPLAPLVGVILVLLCGLRALQEYKGRRGHYPDNAMVGARGNGWADAMAGTSWHSCRVPPFASSNAAG
jgi:hypothetical protein